MLIEFSLEISLTAFLWQIFYFFSQRFIIIWLTWDKYLASSCHMLKSMLFFLPYFKSVCSGTKHMTHPVSVNMAWVLEFCLPCLPESSNLLVSTQKYSVHIYFFLLGKLVMIGFIPNLPILWVSWHPDQIIFIDPTGPKKSRAKKKKYWRSNPLLPRYWFLKLSC